MKLKRIRGFFLPLLIVFVCVCCSGCCRWKYCDCPPATAYFILSPTGDFCAGVAGGHTRVVTYDVFWNQSANTELHNSCDVEIGWIGSPGYYVFISDSTGAADTLKVISLSQVPAEDNKCCSCAGPVNGVHYEVNGVGTSSVSDHINLPF